ncbi:MAG: BrnT family toxin [Elusimicrobia bacterium]|nr:BrnT family toxin [Elusimicrobiota bacterium]
MNPIIPPWHNPPIFEWDDENEQHLARHGVMPVEVEECFDGPHQVIPHKKAAIDQRYSDRFAVVGFTCLGRKLMIIVRHLGGDMIRPITSWEI